MTRLGLEQFADAVVSARWMERVSLTAIAREAGLTVEQVLDRVTALGLPPRKPPAMIDRLAELGAALRSG